MTISITISLLVSLPVGVVIGLTLPKVVRSCGQGVRRRRRENREREEDAGKRRESKEGGEEGEDIYEEPDKMATVITLSENEAYGLSQIISKSGDQDMKRSMRLLLAAVLAGCSLFHGGQC